MDSGLQPLTTEKPGGKSVAETRAAVMRPLGGGGKDSGGQDEKLGIKRKTYKKNEEIGRIGRNRVFGQPFCPLPLRDRVNHAFVGPFFGDPAPVSMVTRCQNKSSDGIRWGTNKLSGPTWIGRESDGYKLRDQETSSLHVRRCSD